MNRITRASIAMLLSLAAALAWAQSGDSGLFLDGLWRGKVDLGEGEEGLELRLFPSDPETGDPGGGLVDMPSRGLFGYPIGELRRGPSGMSFILLGDAPFSGAFELSGSPSVSGGSFGAAGVLRLLSGQGAGSKVLASGSFSLTFAGSSSRGEAFGSDYLVDTRRGLLRGSLLDPRGDPSAADEERDGALPVVLLVSGAQADRDGNNYSVPGRSDCLAQLAQALRAAGVASLRFDKRGTGESYRLGADESKLRFDDHIADAEAALRELASDPHFSSVLVAGFAEGALVGASALGALLADGRIPRERFAGLVALCASGKSELELAQEALASTPPELAAEAVAIMAALKAGRPYPNPSAYFADYFRPSAQAYLSSLFARSPREALAALPCQVIVVAGGSDLQTSGEESELLASSRSDIAYRVIPGMSHALKAVGADEEANYASFTDPSIPLADGLAELIAAAARGEEPRPADEGAIESGGEPNGQLSAGSGPGAGSVPPGEPSQAPDGAPEGSPEGEDEALPR